MRYFLIGLLVVATVVANDNPFSSIKRELSEAACVHFEFISQVESKIFDVIDSTAGIARLSNDGRYRLEIGGETYLNDGEFLYCYIPSNNQVTIETIAEDDNVTESISFLTHLEDIYQTLDSETDSMHQLVRRDSTASDLPDELQVWLDEARGRIVRLGFIDINEDPNLIFLQKQTIDTICVDSLFVPNFPDSVERVRLF